MKPSPATSAVARASRPCLASHRPFCIALLFFLVSISRADVTQRIVDHKNCHRKIAEIYYEKLDDAAKHYGAAIIAKRYQGHGKDPAAAVSDAIKRGIKEVTTPVMDNVEKVSSKVQERYDAITNHGRREIAPEEAIKRAISEIERQ